MSEIWSSLGSRPATGLVDARLECHHALQLMTHAARAYLTEAPDDSHTNVGWNSRRGALAGREIPAPAGNFRLELEIGAFTLQWVGVGQGRLPLAGVSPEDAASWVRGRLAAAGLDPALFDRPLHFEIPSRAVTGAFAVSDGEAYAELGRYYGGAAHLLEEMASSWNGSEVRCWPHHFDVATLVNVGESSIGIGMSPGDGSYPQPYFYVTPWPYPADPSLPELTGGALWHTEGWVGAVLTAEALLANTDRSAAARRFLSEAYEAVRGLLPGQ